MTNALLVALGVMGKRYQKALETVFGEDLNLYTVDPKFPTNHGSRHYADIAEVPDNIAFDIAVDARPNLGRMGVFKHFLVRNIPRIVIEKPSASSMEESRAMLALYQQAVNKPTILVPFYRRFTSAFAPQTLSKLDAGQLKSVVISAGAVGLGCVGIHYVDLANYLFGATPTDVYAQLELGTIPSPRGEQFKDDAGTLIVNYPNGRFVLNLLSDSTAGANITLLYERGKIQFLDQRGYQWLWFRQPRENWQEPYYKTHQEVMIDPPEPYGFNLEEMMAKGIRALCDDKVSIPTLEDGHHALQVLALAMKSSQEGRTIAWTDQSAIEAVSFHFT